MVCCPSHVTTGIRQNRRLGAFSRVQSSQGEHDPEASLQGPCDPHRRRLSSHLVHIQSPQPRPASTTVAWVYTQHHGPHPDTPPSAHTQPSATSVPTRTRTHYLMPRPLVGSSPATHVPGCHLGLSPQTHVLPQWVWWAAVGRGLYGPAAVALGFLWAVPEWGPSHQGLVSPSQSPSPTSFSWVVRWVDAHRPASRLDRGLSTSVHAGHPGWTSSLPLPLPE